MINTNQSDVKYDLVSIIMPCFNCSLHIKRAIDSVYAQTNRNWELIIVDDCSTDNSVNEILKTIKDFNNVHLITSSLNGGTAAARNKGLRAAKGRYIVFLDGDDMIFSDFLEKQLAFISEKKAAIVTASYHRIASKTDTIFVVPSLITYKELLNGNSLSCLTTMFDKKKVGERYFCENLRKCEDFAFWLNILRDGFVAYGNQEPLANYYIISTSKSRKKLQLIKYMWFVFHKNQKLNFFSSSFHIMMWSFYGFRKYFGVR